MNIAIVSPEFPPQTNWGGIARFNESLANLCVINGHNTHVITYGDNHLKQKTPYKIHYFNKTPFNRFFNHFYYLLINFLKRFFPRLMLILDFNLLSFFVFRSLAKKIKFDLLFSPSYHSSTILIHFFYPKIKIISHFQGSVETTNLDQPKNLDLKLAIALENYYIAHVVDELIYCSEDIKQRHLRKHGYLKNKSRVIHNFIDCQRYATKQKINKNSLVYFGRIEYRKGVDVLLHSFIDLAAKNPLLNVHLIGKKMTDFPYRNSLLNIDQLLSLKNIDNKIASRIHFYEEMKNVDELIVLLKKMKGIAVLPARYEPFGFTTIEAMAMGFVTIASQHGGGKEIIANGKNGFLIKANVVDLSKTLQRIFNYKDEDLDAIGQLARKTVAEKFSLQAMSKLYFN